METHLSKKIIYKKRIQEVSFVYDFLSLHTKLEPKKIKEVLEKGGFWIQRKGQKKLLRCRSEKTKLEKDDRIEIYYDSEILAISAPQAILLEEEKIWGVWYKPAGLLSQGTKYSDHASLLRQVEKIKGKAYLIHRLDKEAMGLMVIAYNSKGASLFSKLWQEKKIEKYYLVEVLSKQNPFLEKSGEIHFPLDQKEAHTSFWVLKQTEKTTLLMVKIHTGRFHQIRRHFNQIGHPVIGDPLYGKGNKNKEGMMLVAYSLKFVHPIEKKTIHYQVPIKFLPAVFQTFDMFPIV